MRTLTKVDARAAPRHAGTRPVHLICIKETPEDMLYRTDEAYAALERAEETGLPRQANHAMLWRAMDAITRLGHEYRVDWADDTSQTAEA